MAESGAAAFSGMTFIKSDAGRSRLPVAKYPRRVNVDHAPMSDFAKEIAISPQTVLDFWFNESSRPFWFKRSDAFDLQIRSGFAGLWQRAVYSELDDWRACLQGRLAEIIVLDQFSRNLFRESPVAFAQDNMAVALAQEAVRQPGFADMQPSERHFMLMPLMHSESRKIHEQALALFERYTTPQALDFEIRHKRIIDRFGRYPHRNQVLGCPSTEEETAFLQEPGSSF